MSEKYPKWLLAIRENIILLFSKYSVPRWMVFVMDNLAVFIVFFLAYILRFNFKFDEINYSFALNQAILTVIVYSIFSLIFKSYSGLLRHTTLTDISLVFIVTTAATVILLGLTLLSRLVSLGEDLTVPISIILIHYVTITVFLFSFRIFVKVIFRFTTSSLRDTKKVLIYGAAELGFIVKRVILSDPENGFNVIGFIDTNKSLQGKRINGIPVFSPEILSAKFLSKKNIETLILAVKDITIEEKTSIIRSAVELGLDVLETPAMDRWLNGQLKVRQFQRIKLEDLLGRAPIQLNMNLIRNGLKNKTILVTGAAGSIGSEIVRQLTRFKTEKTILVDQAETPMFYLENELNERFSNLLVQLVIADVTNKEKMENIFKEFHPDIVFHAAAYKHVPLMEENPHEAIRVNVGGTKLLTELSVKYNVEKFVMISTDKSVNPTSVMGASKRICEKIVQLQSQKEGMNTQFVITRFGNVMGSNGSVIPLFSEQIEKGGPVTVTHPEITRYFMTIQEACGLVLEAGFMGNGGEIFVFDMGDPVKIADLANQMIRLSGLIPEKDIKIVYTGLRPGEKLYEELLTDKEITIPTHHPKIKKAQVEKLDGPATLSKVEGLIINLYSLSNEKLVRRICEIVKEFKCSNRKYSCDEVGGTNQIASEGGSSN